MELDFHVTAPAASEEISSKVTSALSLNMHLSDAKPPNNLMDEDCIVAACSAPDRHMLSDPEYESLVIKVSDSSVVKFGEVSVTEARNQRLAHRILDPRIVRVPEVYHYFTRGSDCYLVMEHIEGSPCASEVSREYIEKIAVAVKDLWSHQDNLPEQAPGPVGGGMTQGMLWENDEIEIEIQNLQDLQKCWKDRLLGQMEPVLFKSSQLIFVHCDIAPRNIMWSEDGILVLPDWAHAGIYPRSFERAALSLNTQQGTEVGFSDSLAELLPVNEEEEAQGQQVLRGGVQWASICYLGHLVVMCRNSANPVRRTGPLVQHARPPPRMSDDLSSLQG